MTDAIEIPIEDTAVDTEQDTYEMSMLKMRLFGHKLLSQQEVIALIDRAQSGDVGARNEIITHNYRLVFSYAARRANMLKSNIDLEDLVQEGTFGLIKAIERFDPKHDVHFSTYADWWIRDSVDRYIMDHKTTVRIPQYLQKAMSVIKYRGTSESGDEKYEKEASLLLKTFLVKSITAGQYYNNHIKATIVSTLIPPDIAAEAASELIQVRSRLSILIQTITDGSVKEDNCNTFLYHTGLYDGIQHSHAKCAVRFGIRRQSVWYRVDKVFKYLNAKGSPYHCLQDIKDELGRIDALTELVQST